MTLKKYDLCVAGAGFAGIAAAVRSARLGLKTLLIEKNAQPGGSARDGMHEWLCGLYDSGTLKPHLLNEGISAELESLLIAGGARKIQMGKVWVLEYSPETLQEIFQKWISSEKNLEVLFETEITGLRKNDGRIQSLEVRNSKGTFSVETASVIDCTGHGAVIRLSGAGYEISPAGERQLAAYAFQLEGVAHPQAVENFKVVYSLTKAVENGRLAPHLRFAVWVPGQSVLRVSVLPSDSGYDLKKIQEQARQVYEILKDAMPEFKNSRIKRMADMAVERESLRMNGVSLLKSRDVLTGLKSKPGDVKSAWPIEFWDQVKGPRYEYLKDGDFYEIPSGCLKSKDISNLFAAGKCVSADARAFSSARMTGTCLAMGEKAAEMVFESFGKYPGSVNIAEWIRRENLENGSRIALRHGASEMSYGELLKLSSGFAEFFRKFKIKKYARAGILVPEGIDYVILNLALLSIQAVIVPVPPGASPAEIEQVISAMKMNLFIFDPALYDASGKTEILKSPAGGVSWQVVSYQPAMPEQAEFESLNPAFIRFTSGTTGESKGVVLSHESILARTDAAGRALQITNRDTVLFTLSMAFHFVVTILLFLRRGASVILCRHEIPAGILEGSSAGDSTFIYASPVHYRAMVQTGEVKAPCFSKVRTAVSTAMPMPAGLARDFNQKFGFELTQAYGIIEAGLPFTAGRLTPGYECRLMDTDENGAGTVCLRGAGLFDAYFSPWKKKEAVMQDGWFETGDIGKFDEQGLLQLLGRRQRVINFMGMKIFPQEIELAVMDYPGIEAVFAEGRPHEVFGEVPAVKIVLKNPEEGFDEESLRRFCYGRLARYKVPKSFEYVSRLNLTASGKVSLNQKGI